MSAYIPGRRQRASDRDSISPAALGDFQFGPRSIIYHEASFHRQQVILPVEDRDEEDRIATSSVSSVRARHLHPIVNGV